MGWDVLVDGLLQFCPYLAPTSSILINDAGILNSRRVLFCRGGVYVASGDTQVFFKVQINDFGR